MTKIKICGITSLNDALLAANLGVDMLGFIFADSPRNVTPELVQQISDALPMTTAKVGVFVDAPVKTVNDIAERCHLDFVQLHGHEDAAYCKEIIVPIIKAIPMKDQKSLQGLSACTPAYFLLDTYRKGKSGGTGEIFDWSLAVKAKHMTDVPIILSGGLNTQNITKAIETVQPDVVDINSCLETSPGKKSQKLMKEIVQLIRKSGI